MNSFVAVYKKHLADTGQKDDRTDYQITQELGDWAKKNNPVLFKQYPDFAEDYFSIQKANTPSLAVESVSSYKQQSADAVPETMMVALLGVVIAGGVAVGLVRLIATRRRPETPVNMGLKWFAWTAAIIALTLLPAFIRKLDGETFASWLIATVFWGGLALGIGWLYGCYRFRSRGPSTATSSASAVPVPTIQPALQQTGPQFVSPDLLPDGGRRLAELKEIFERGLISRQEYDSKREAIIAQL